MIGMSLSYKNLLATDDVRLKPECLLPKLWEKGVRSIELRSVSANADPNDVLRIAELIWSYGFGITVHGNCKHLSEAVSEVFAPLSLLLENFRQRELIITLHPIKEDNVAMLKVLSEYAEEKGYPVRIALENNRKMPDGSDGDSLSLVLDAVVRANCKNVGICFDMGHFAWYAANFTDSPNTLPPKEFLSRVIHTHIHSYEEGTTHFPLREWREPISLYIEALAYKYYGIYNVELSSERFAHIMHASDAYLLSADTLSANYPQVARFYDAQRLSYDENFGRAMEILNKDKGSYVTLIAPSAYLLSIDGYRFAIDPAFQHLSQLAESPSRVREYLGNIDLIMLTHAHDDHMEESTVRALADTDITWIVPDFLISYMIRFGVPREKLISVREGDEITSGPLKIRVLKGRHFRPDGNGISSVGYLICAENAPTLAFPGDVRDYGTDELGELCADHCFAHVWLSDNATDPSKYLPMILPLAEFSLKISKDSIFLAHLDANRRDGKRWTEHHAAAVRDAIIGISPETSVHIPRYGEIFNLSEL
jgi:sugar phosphate isomerase/epimerase